MGSKKTNNGNQTGAEMSNASGESDGENDQSCSVVKIESDKIGFYGPIKRSTMTELITTMYSVAKELPMIHARGSEPAKPKMYLIISTNGGSLYDAFAAYDHIQKIKKNIDVVTVAEGFVSSAGTILVLAGTERLIMRNCGMLFHQLSSEVHGKFNEMQDEVEGCTWLMNKMCRLYSRKSNLSIREVRKLLDGEKTLSAKKCIAMGFVSDYY